MKVKDCMHGEICSVKANSKVCEVINLMKEKHIGSVPVCDDENKVCGIITDRDILLRSVACDKDVKQTPVSDIMTCNVCTCTEDEEITNAQSKMSKNQVRRLPVCDENNKVVGMLTIGDLIHHDDEVGKKQVCTTFENICNDNSMCKNAE